MAAILRVVVFVIASSACVCAGEWVVAVTDPAGVPIPGARIQSTGPFASATVLTDIHGEWRTTIPIISGSGCVMLASTPTVVTSITKPGYTFNLTNFVLPCGPVSGVIPVRGVGTALPSWIGVAAASYTPNLAHSIIASSFGTGLADTTAAAVALPLPQELAGRKVKLITPSGFEVFCGLLYVSPTQINFVLPSVFLPQPASPALLVLSNGLADIREQAITLRAVAPSIFSADSTGSGLAAAYVTRIGIGGAMTQQAVARFDEPSAQLVPIPIEFTPGTDRMILSLFATGIRNAATSSVQVEIGGVTLPVNFAGNAMQFEGLDQIDVELTRALIGRGLADVRVSADSLAGNIVKVHFQ